MSCYKLLHWMFFTFFHFFSEITTRSKPAHLTSLIARKFSKLQKNSVSCFFAEKNGKIGSRHRHYLLKRYCVWLDKRVAMYQVSGKLHIHFCIFVRNSHSNVAMWTRERGLRISRTNVIGEFWFLSRILVQMPHWKSGRRKGTVDAFASVPISIDFPYYFDAFYLDIIFFFLIF